jgi:hypothetical protein
MEMVETTRITKTIMTMSCRTKKVCANLMHIGHITHLHYTEHSHAPYRFIPETVSVLGDMNSTNILLVCAPGFTSAPTEGHQASEGRQRAFTHGSTPGLSIFSCRRSTPHCELTNYSPYSTPSTYHRKSSERSFVTIAMSLCSLTCS